MEPTADVVVVADPVDRVATEVVQLTENRGAKADLIDLTGASLRFTISLNGDEVALSPASAMFLRVPPGPLLRAGFDEAFLRDERLAALWAAAALSPSPVINRPTVHGFVGRAAFSAVVVEQRAGVAAGPCEVYSDRPPAPPASEASQASTAWCVEEACTRITTVWPELPSDGPYRARRSRANPLYEIVAVLNQNAWRASTAPLEHLDLEAASIRIMAALELTFGAVLWSIAADHGSANLTRVEPFPPFEHLRFVWPTLGPALVDALLP